jgi:hypothetical protein
MVAMSALCQRQTHGDAANSRLVDYLVGKTTCNVCGIEMPSALAGLGGEVQLELSCCCTDVGSLALRAAPLSGF